MVFSEAGEFADNCIIQEFLTTAAVTKGQVLLVSPAATPTAAPCSNADQSMNGTYAVAIEAAASGAYVRAVIYGEVGVDASGNCYGGAVVYGKGGAAVARSMDTTKNQFTIGRQPLGRVTVGAASGSVATVFVGVVT